MTKPDGPVPVLALSAAQDLPAVVAAFARQLRPPPPPPPQQTEARRRRAAAAARALLPHCTIGPPLAEHAAHVLSDVAGGLRDLAALAATEEGRFVIRDYLGEDAEGVVAFWLSRRPVA